MFGPHPRAIGTHAPLAHFGDRVRSLTQVRVQGTLRGQAIHLVLEKATRLLNLS